MKFAPWIISLVLALYIIITAFTPRIDPLNQTTVAGRIDLPTWTPVVIEKKVEVVVTATPSAVAMVAEVLPLKALTTATTVPATLTPTVTATPQVVASTVQGANLRSGPGTNYDITGGLPADTALDIVGRNAAGDWYHLANGSWIYGSLVSNAPTELPVVEAPPPPTTVPVPTAAPAMSEPVVAEPVHASQDPGGLVGTINVDSWRFEISDVKVDPGLDVNRKSIIFLGYVYNEGTQTDTFGTLYTLVLQDSLGRTYQEESRVTWAAEDKYGTGYRSFINPEARSYIAIGYDVPAAQTTFTLVPGSLAASWGQNVTVTVP